MLKKISALLAIAFTLYPLPALADWRALGADLSGNQWFIKDNSVLLENPEA